MRRTAAQRVRLPAEADRPGRARRNHEKVCRRCEEQPGPPELPLSTANRPCASFAAQGATCCPAGKRVAAAYNRRLHLAADNEILICVHHHRRICPAHGYAPDLDAELDEFSLVERLELFIAGLPNDFSGVLIKLRDGQWLSPPKASCAEFKSWRGKNAEAQRWISLFLRPGLCRCPRLQSNSPTWWQPANRWFFLWGWALPWRIGAALSSPRRAGAAATERRSALFSRISGAWWNSGWNNFMTSASPGLHWPGPGRNDLGV